MPYRGVQQRTFQHKYEDGSIRTIKVDQEDERQEEQAQLEAIIAGPFHGGLTQEQIDRFRTLLAKRPVITSYLEAYNDAMARVGAMLEMSCTTYDWGMRIGEVLGQERAGMLMAGVLSEAEVADELAGQSSLH